MQSFSFSIHVPNRFPVRSRVTHSFYKAVVAAASATKRPSTIDRNFKFLAAGIRNVLWLGCLWFKHIKELVFLAGFQRTNIPLYNESIHQVTNRTNHRSDIRSRERTSTRYTYSTSDKYANLRISRMSSSLPVHRGRSPALEAYTVVRWLLSAW